MQKLQLSIPEPCHENWQDMTPTEQGRFCKACAKEVIDFSTMTDTQVLNYFTNLSNEKVCGRALPEQLDRAISRPVQPKKKLFWYWNYMVMFFMLFTRGSQANAQSAAKEKTEVNPLKKLKPQEDVIVMGNLSKPESRLINGKVTDEDGNPVSFATVKIKGSKTGTSADINGNYSIRINPGYILEISGAGFKTEEVHTGNSMVYNTILEKDKKWMAGEVVVVGIMSRDPDGYYGSQDKLNRVAVLNIKDDITGKSIPHASILISNEYKKITDTVQADKNGLYKLKRIKEGDKYQVKVAVTGYEPNEFTIDEYDFKDRKKIWNVLLRKQKTDVVNPTTNPLTISQPSIRIGQVSEYRPTDKVLYVVDGAFDPKGKDINPADVDSYEIMQSPAAMALFGLDAANGAVVITTRKTKAKNLDTVIVNADRNIKGAFRVSGVVSCSSRSTSISYMQDTIASIRNFINSAVKIYPDPVQRGTNISIVLKLPKAGFYEIEIADLSGKLLLQRTISADATTHTEQMPADTRWAAGLYYFRIFDTKNKLINKARFIVK